MKDLVAWVVYRAEFLAGGLALALVAGWGKTVASDVRHDWVVREGRGAVGMIRAWRSDRHGCMAMLNYQLEKDYAPTVDVPAGPALCDAIAGKDEVPVKIHFIPEGFFKGTVVLDDPALSATGPPRPSRRGLLRIGLAYLLVPLFFMALTALIRKASTKSAGSRA